MSQRDPHERGQDKKRPARAAPPCGRADAATLAAIGHLISRLAGIPEVSQLAAVAAEEVLQWFHATATIVGGRSGRAYSLIALAPGHHIQSAVAIDQAAVDLALPVELAEAAAEIGSQLQIRPTSAAEPLRTPRWHWVARRTHSLSYLLAIADPADPVADALEAWAEGLAAVADLLLREQRFRKLSDTDPLTSLLNRRAFDRALARETGRFRRYRRIFSLVLLDLDNFRRVNEMLGHAGGDDVLRRVAQWLSSSVRRSDVLARVGGDEFGIICPETSADQAQAMLARLDRGVQQLPGLPIRISLTGGIAEPAGPETTPADLFRAADEALLRNKKYKRHRPTDEELG